MQGYVPACAEALEQSRKRFAGVSSRSGDVNDADAGSYSRAPGSPAPSPYPPSPRQAPPAPATTTGT
jgi:hypothetical protein